MATTPNNFFAENIFTREVVSRPTGAPVVITINPYAEGITDYTISAATLGAYTTYFNIVGLTIGTTFTFYVPSVNGLLGQTIVIKNSADSPVAVTPSTNALIDEGQYGTVTLKPPGSTGELGAVTLMANPTNIDTWYITNTFVQI
jgi:hypothetical protein